MSHILGTDRTGRDVFSRVLHGSRISSTIALISIAGGILIGVPLGLASGYFGGFVDDIIMRLVEITYAIPLILIALLLAIVMGPGFKTIIITVMLINWSRYARQTRAEVLVLVQKDFVALARVAGCSPIRIMFVHLLPNVMNTLLVLSSLYVGIIILLEASLSFLGAGISPPTPSWGLMTASGRDFIASAYWLSLFPGLAIAMTVLSMNMLGDWLRDKLDPKLRQV